MKQVLVIILFLCLIIPLAGVYIGLILLKDQTRKEVKELIISTLQKEDLVLLKFTHVDAQQQLYWEHAKEFEYNHEMYDVVETSITNDSVYYWCWPDDQETALNNQLRTLTAHIFGRSTKHKEQHQSILHFYKTWYHTYNLTEKDTLFSWDDQQITMPFLRYLSPEYSPLSPPPKWG